MIHPFSHHWFSTTTPDHDEDAAAAADEPAAHDGPDERWTDTRTLHVERSTSTGHRLSHYDGACANVHGHNMQWDVTLTVSMVGTGADNMPLDLKTVADCIDHVDHALVLNANDPLVEHAELLGDVITTPGDPTCEYMAEWMADRLLAIDDAVLSARVRVEETDKYGISHSAHTAVDDGEAENDA